MAHIGLIEVLDQEGIDFDAVAGTSMGAVVAASYALGKSSTTMRRMLKDIFSNNKSIFDKSLPFISFFRGKKLENMLIKLFARFRFEDLDIDYYCNSSDLVSGKEVIFERGYLATALRASISIPVLFPPVRMGNYVLVDGGIINNLPGHILRAKGVRKVIGCNASSHLDKGFLEKKIFASPKHIWRNLKDYLHSPPIIRILTRSVNVQSLALMEHCKNDFDYLFSPDLDDFGIFDFQHAEAIIERGRKATLDHLDQIKSALL